MSAAVTLSTYETDRLITSRDRFKGIVRPYAHTDVMRLRGSIHVEYTLARLGAERLWDLLHDEPFVAALGALTGNQAVQQVRAGLKAIYLSGWQVAADANTYGRMYPDQSLYPVDSVPNVVRRINAALLRADQIEVAEGKRDRYWLAPIVADAEAGFGGPLNAHELMKSMIEAGAAGVHFEDQLASEKKCGHMGGKVLVPTSQFIRTLVAARLAADIYDVPTVLVARTDADSAKLITSDIDERDRAVHRLEGAHAGRLLPPQERRRDRHRARPRVRALRGHDLVRDVDARPQAGAGSSPRASTSSSRTRCSRTTARRRSTGRRTSTTRRSPSSSASSARWATSSSSSRSRASTRSTTECSSSPASTRTAAWRRTRSCSRRSSRAEADGYTATRHQREVGTGYFDQVAEVISSGTASDAGPRGLDREAPVLS